jgi:molybdenum cofactor cytidylyltransferase
MRASDTSIIILAAGSSSRLGLPKQLLTLKNKSLLRLIAEKALEVQPREVIAVLGFESDRMQRELDDLPIRIVLNNEWREGVGSSVRAGIKAVDSQSEGALIALCDQPRVTSELLNQLIDSCSHQKPIAATEYTQALGVPACFDRSVFPELLLLQGDAGAKQLIAEDRARVAVHPFPHASLDIDTLEDYRNERSSG